MLSTALYCQYCIPGLQTNTELFLTLQRFQDPKEEFVLEALVLVPPNKTSRVNQARVAVAELTSTSVLCWATTKVQEGTPYEALMVACVHGPTEAGQKSQEQAELVEAFMKQNKTYLQGSSKQTLPSGKSADTLKLPTQGVNSWVLGPSCFQPAPVRLLTAAAASTDCRQITTQPPHAHTPAVVCSRVMRLGATLQAVASLVTDKQQHAVQSPRLEWCLHGHMTHVSPCHGGA